MCCRFVQRKRRLARIMPRVESRLFGPSILIWGLSVLQLSGCIYLTMPLSLVGTVLFAWSLIHGGSVGPMVVMLAIAPGWSMRF